MAIFPDKRFVPTRGGAAGRTVAAMSVINRSGRNDDGRRGDIDGRGCRAAGGRDGVNRVDSRRQASGRTDVLPEWLQVRVFQRHQLELVSVS